MNTGSFSESAVIDAAVPWLGEFRAALPQTSKAVREQGAFGAVGRVARAFRFAENVRRKLTPAKIKR